MWNACWTMGVRRRLDVPGDWVRREVALALAPPGDEEQGDRVERLVIPVLVDGAQAPEAADLPPDLRELATRDPLTELANLWRDDESRSLFFALMVGDIGYGILFIILGFWMLKSSWKGVGIVTGQTRVRLTRAGGEISD